MDWIPKLGACMSGPPQACRLLGVNDVDAARVLRPLPIGGAVCERQHRPSRSDGGDRVQDVHEDLVLATIDRTERKPSHNGKQAR